MSTREFDSQKKQALSGVDLSKKGSVDERILSLVALLNENSNFFTTSSCSGRVIIIDDKKEGYNEKEKPVKKGCHWLFTSHDEASYEKIIKSLTSDPIGEAVFKFEPFVLHLQCRTLELAQKMLSCAVSSGFRNSGISIGNKGKTLVAVRSTHGLEVPLSVNGNLLVSNEYIEYITVLSNKKLVENFRRIDRFYENVKSMMDSIQSEMQTVKQKMHIRQKRNVLGRDERPAKTSTEKKPSEREDLVDIFDNGALFQEEPP